MWNRLLHWRYVVSGDTMVDPLSITIGIAVAVFALLAGLGVAFIARFPDHIVNMREVRSYQMQVNANRTLNDSTQAVVEEDN